MIEKLDRFAWFNSHFSSEPTPLIKWCEEVQKGLLPAYVLRHGRLGRHRPEKYDTQEYLSWGFIRRVSVWHENEWKSKYWGELCVPYPAFAIMIARPGNLVSLEFPSGEKIPKAFLKKHFLVVYLDENRGALWGVVEYERGHQLSEGFKKLNKKPFESKIPRFNSRVWQKEFANQEDVMKLLKGLPM